MKKEMVEGLVFSFFSFSDYENTLKVKCIGNVTLNFTNFKWLNKSIKRNLFFLQSSFCEGPNKTMVMD